MKLSTLASIVAGRLIGEDTHYNAVSIDSRTTKKGELFIAIRGKCFDGHAFIQQALSRGAAAVLVEKKLSRVERPWIQVTDTQQALARLASYHRQRFSIPVIALTGSCGKTTTKEMLRAILRTQGEVLASDKSFNNALGVPLTLLSLTSKHQFAVVELGTSHAGEIAYLAKLTRPNFALVTNVAEAHLEGLGSIECVADEKSDIFLGLLPGGVGVINHDDPFEPGWSAKLQGYQVVRFGLKEGAEFSACEIELDAQGRIRCRLVTPKGSIVLKLALAGKHNLLNALGAAALASQVGVSLRDIKRGLEGLSELPEGRLHLLTTQTGATLIDDTYNANPCSVAAALALLSHYPGQRIFVMGDMSELGERAAYYHKKIGKLAKKLCIEEVYTCGKLTALTSEAFGTTENHYATQEALVNALKLRLQRGVTLLVKGSRYAQMEKVVHALS